MDTCEPLQDPCPCPRAAQIAAQQAAADGDAGSSRRRGGAAIARALNAKETLLYAPLSDVGNIIYDKDAMYIQLHDVQFSKAEDLDQTADDAHRGRAGDGPGSSSDEDGGGNSNGAIGPAVPPTEGQKMVHSLQGLGADGASSGTWMMP